MDRVARLAEQIGSRVLASKVRPCLCAISGIDGSGKGAVAAAVAEQLTRQGRRVASLTADDWHAPRAVRFAAQDPGQVFYQHGLRLDEMMAQLVDPLHRAGSLDTTLPIVDPRTDAEIVKTFRFTAIDAIVLEGIFLLKRALRRRYDLSFWLDCSFETALWRALRRNQEGLAEDALRAVYERIYFPAQLVHLARDRPQAAATAVLGNDSAWD